ncbi:type VI secretion system contractile sheath small subunit [Pigmentibacter sp. JX0631]|uniref:type VI secretion system contractile sheath small subunit n=1 Tax=Pigmentibacter sp. JX0631 TaxID=2976982 RepID=UPI0024699347|nr:type VI secretion system contractile sheath small subunit [Pigmentibacter sp. JX0631]WGL60325.1 type VI secretion system contractile sheath small subunit [Pigmentibacter sp. JX0631]
MASESTQHKISRIRKPRVQITYDLEIGDAREKKELPLVVGVIADLQGHSTPSNALKERKFVDIEKANFDLVMSKISPALNISVANKIKGTEGEKREFNLKFESIDDFKPGNLVKNVECLNELLDKRKSLLDLISKVDTNDKLHLLLLEAAKDSNKAKTLIESKETPPETKN